MGLISTNRFVYPFSFPWDKGILTCATQLGETPTDIQKATASEAKVAQPVGVGGASSDDDLQARLDSLRR